MLVFILMSIVNVNVIVLLLLLDISITIANTLAVSGKVLLSLWLSPWLFMSYLKLLCLLALWYVSLSVLVSSEYTGLVLL